MAGTTRQVGAANVGASPRAARAFTLVELLVAITVMTILIGLLVPALAGVREHARRVVCASNQRQMGLALNMFADQNKGRLPSSVFLPVYEPGSEYRPQDMVIVRTDQSNRALASAGDGWDGLGFLYAQQYLPASSVYYCPSHRGGIRLETYESQWHDLPGEIVSNYHYRGMGPEGHTNLAMIPSDAALVSDSLRSVDELNHEGGFNVLQAGLAVVWNPDDNGLLGDMLLRTDEAGDAETSASLWRALDGVASESVAGAGIGH